MHWAVSKPGVLIGVLFLLGLMIIGIWTHFMWKTEILEFEDIYDYKLRYDPETKVPVEIAGLCGKSMKCVSGITTERQDSSLVIFIKIGFCKKGQSGSFYYPLAIPDDVRELKFGRKQHLLWSRN